MTDIGTLDDVGDSLREVEEALLDFESSYLAELPTHNCVKGWGGFVEASASVAPITVDEVSFTVHLLWVSLC